MSPQTVSHFEILHKLGEGGMGTVYKARDVRLDRVVALKFLSSQRQSAEQHARFLQEGRALSALSHPNVATVYEVDDMDGAPFLALEYLAGGTLRSRIRLAGGLLPVSSIISWGADLADGLAHVHRHAIVHRDVTSSNVMFDAEGRVKLTDFGLAHSSGSGHGSAGHKVAGTIGYLAPEQLQGQAADARSDLYSLGVVLYEMATGRMPLYGKDTNESIRLTLVETPRPVRELRQDLPSGLEDVIQRLLEKRPADRFARAQDVASALRNLQSSTPGEEPTLTVPDIRTTRRLLLRRRWFLALTCLCLLALVLGAGGIRRWRWRAGLPARKHLVVLPFRNIGGDAGQQAFCDGITEMLTTAMTKHGGFSVVPAVEARRLEGAAQARKEYGVNLVISGSVQHRGDQVRITVNLIDAATLRQIEAEPVSWPVAQLFQIDDVVLSKVSDLLNVTDHPPGLFTAGASQLPSAYDSYLRGRGYLYRYDKSGNLDRALGEFERAVQQDSRFALAYIGRAEVQMRYYRNRRAPADLEASRASAVRAIELNPQLAGGHIALGAALNELRQFAPAIAEFELALKLDPLDPAGYRELGALYRAQNRLADAEKVYLRAIEMRPGDWLGYSNLGVFYARQQRYADAEKMFRALIDIAPDNHLGYRNLGQTLHLLGRAAEAEKMFRQALDLNPSLRSYSNLGAFLIFHERYAEAVTTLREGVKLASDSPGDYMPFGNLGDAYQLSGAPAELAVENWTRALGIVETRLNTAPNDPELLATRGLYRAKLGQRDLAVQDAESAAALPASNATIRHLNALTYAVAGFQDRALQELAAAIQQGYSVEEIRHDPEFKPLRGTSPFEQMLSQSAPR